MCAPRVLLLPAYATRSRCAAATASEARSEAKPSEVDREDGERSEPEARSEAKPSEVDREDAGRGASERRKLAIR
jgi:hypothetical protein